MRLVDEPSGGEVIDIADIDRTERLSVKDERWGEGCRHKRTEIDARLRVVECRDCHERLDPIEVLIDIAKSWRRESMHAKTIRDAQQREWDKETERQKRHVRLHVRCFGCGRESRLTTGKLTDEDWAAWMRHWQEDPVLWWGEPEDAEPHPHRRETEDDVEASRRAIEPVPRYGGAIYVERAP